MSMYLDQHISMIKAQVRVLYIVPLEHKETPLLPGLHWPNFEFARQNEFLPFLPSWYFAFILSDKLYGTYI